MADLAPTLGGRGGVPSPQELDRIPGRADQVWSGQTLEEKAASEGLQTEVGAGRAGPRPGLWSAGHRGFVGQGGQERPLKLSGGGESGEMQGPEDPQVPALQEGRGPAEALRPGPCLLPRHSDAPAPQGLPAPPSVTLAPARACPRGLPGPQRGSRRSWPLAGSWAGEGSALTWGAALSPRAHSRPIQSLVSAPSRRPVSLLGRDWVSQTRDS